MGAQKPAEAQRNLGCCVDAATGDSGEVFDIPLSPIPHLFSTTNLNAGAPHLGLRKKRSSTSTNSSALTASLSSQLQGDPASSLSSLASSGPPLSPASTSSSEWYDLSHETLDAKIRGAMRGCVQWTQGSGKRFLPADEIEELICADNIRSDNMDHAHIVSSIVPDRRKLFAILTMMDRGSVIVKLIDEGIRDNHLPLQLDPDKGSLYRSDSSEGLQEIKCFAVNAGRNTSNQKDEWLHANSDSFNSYQWQLLAPRLSMLCPYNDSDLTPEGPAKHDFSFPETILPFTASGDEQVAPEMLGGFSRVVKVHIHPAHRENICQRCEGACLKASYAVKSIHKSCKSSDVLNEINSLKRFDGKDHRDRLVRLLCTFKYHEQFHLVFLWADANLQELWEKRFPDVKNPQRGLKLARWVAGEMLGIAQGLHLIHNAGPAAGRPDDERTRGRHGDIKPENILWFKHKGHLDDNHSDQPVMSGMLKISDFGLADFRSKGSVSRVEANSIGMTHTYRAPEWETQNHISQSYDFWSLGCVLLQFVTWYIGGWEAVDDFAKRRSECSNPRTFGRGTVTEDTFFTLDMGGHKKSVSPNTAVGEQFRALHRHEICSDMFVEILNFIEGRLLQIQPNDRARSEELVMRFQVIYDKCYDNEAYCTSRTHTTRTSSIRTPSITSMHPKGVPDEHTRPKSSRSGVRAFLQKLNCCF